MFQNFVDLLRARWPHMAVALALLWGLSPHALPAPLTTNVQAAGVALAARRLDAAMDALDLAMAYEPAVASLQFFSARLALAHGDPARASAYLEAALDVFPTAPIDHCLKASISAMQQNAADAEAHWRRAESSCSNQAEFLHTLAELYWSQGALREALPILESVLEVDPEDPGTLLRLGILHSIMPSDEALTYLRSAQIHSNQVNPLTSSLVRLLEEIASEENQAFKLARTGQVLAQHGAWIPAEYAFRQSLAIDPEYTEARAYLGMVLEQLGKDGYRELRSAISDSPALAMPRIFMAYHWQRLDSQDKARVELEIAARLDPTNPAISAELGAVYAAIGDLEAAEQAYRIATELSPQDPLFWTLLAEFSIGHEIEIRELGLPAARNALILNPGDSAIRDLLGYAHLLLGNLELAERLLWQAAAEQPNLPGTQFHIGLLRQLQGDPTRAQAAWRLAIQLDPQGPFADLARRALSRP